jgi:hypothetical protein
MDIDSGIGGHWWEETTCTGAMNTSSTLRLLSGTGKKRGDKGDIGSEASQSRWDGAYWKKEH